MAATVLSVCGTGEFGTRIASIMASRLPDLTVTDSVATAFESATDTVVVISWRPWVREFEEADDLAYRSGTRWLPVALEHPVLRVGPWACPPAGPCHGCYRARRAQHDRQWPGTRLLRAAYHRDPELGHRGFLPAHARVAAGFTELLLRQGPRPGTVFTIGLTSARVAAHPVVPVHGCPRCGGAGPAPSRLAEELGWSHAN